MKSDAIIKKEGFEALRGKLNPVELERFIVILNRENFDYTKWRSSLFENMPLEELAREADQFSRQLNEES